MDKVEWHIYIWFTSTLPPISSLNTLWVDTVQTGDGPLTCRRLTNRERDSGLIFTLISPHTPRVHYI